jgi:SAM-dependent methyltransferase
MRSFEPDAYPAPLAERRPGWVQELMAAKYQGVCRRIGWGYNGTEPDYRLAGMYSVRTQSLIHELKAEHPDRPLRILDIGCAAGAFVRANIWAGHDAQGISAVDHRPGQAAIDAMPIGSYIVGNAEDLPHVIGVEGPYDLTVSRHTLRHVGDPLALVEAAADLVGVGGILAIDTALDDGVPRLDNNAYDQPVQAVDLERSGFALHPNSPSRVMDFDDGLVLRRESDEPLRLSATYVEVPGAEFPAYARLVE